MINLTRICTRCGTEVEKSSPCPHCSDESNWKNVDLMTPEEKVKEFESWCGVLEISFDQMMDRIQQLFGRSLYIHEFLPSNALNLKAELLLGIQPTEQDIIDLIPPEKLIIFNLDDLEENHD